MGEFKFVRMLPMFEAFRPPPLLAALPPVWNEPPVAVVPTLFADAAAAAAA